MATSNATAFTVIDSHVHLYAASHISSLDWITQLPSDHPLQGQHSVSDYIRAAAPPTQQVRGFVFVETARNSSLDDAGWTHALEEIRFLLRIANGTPLQNEGHSPRDASLVLGIVPWAPVEAGSEALARYVGWVKSLCNSNNDLFGRIKGFRYLVQDKPHGTMTQPQFIDALKWLGMHHFSFDLGIDAHLRGLTQMQEACEMMARVNEEGSSLTIIVNHFAKPDLCLAFQDDVRSTVEFKQWEDCVNTMASYPHVYMKLSGFFSKLPSQRGVGQFEVQDLIHRVKPWTDVIFRSFRPARIMFGSDWPVCDVQGPSVEDSWRHWRDIVEAILDDQGLDDEQKTMVWAGTAAKAYRLS